MLSWLPENVSTYGGKIDGVFALIYYIVGAWFLLAEGLLLYFVVRYRRKEGRKAAYVPANDGKTLSWVLVPVGLVLLFDLAIDAAGAEAWKEVKLNLPPPGQTIRVRGRQFAWEFTHPGQDGQLGTADDIQTLNQLHVPMATVVQFSLESSDVIHSFWLPFLRLKQDAVPGRTIRGWFEATKEGEFPIGCAEICGMGHGNMKGTLHVYSPENYQAWLTSQYEETEE